MRARAGVVATFDPDDILALGTSSGDVIDFLDQECHLVPMADGPAAWTLDDAVRTRLFASADRADLVRARAAVKEVPDSAVQQALDRSLDAGWSTWDVAELDDEATAALSVVARWWSGSRYDVPNPEDLADHLRRRLLFADARSMASDHFVGREDVLDELRQRFSDTQGKAVVLWGVGGVGKSALVARLVVEAVDEGLDELTPDLVALLDFDDPAINPMYPAELVAAITEQLDVQLAAGSREFSNVRSKVVSESAYSGYRSASSGRTVTGPDTYWADLLGQAVDGMVVGSRLLVVMDTVEQAQRRGPSAMYALADVVGELCRRSHVLVLLSGRARVPELAAITTTTELLGLAEPDAVTLMVDLAEGAVDRDHAQTLVRRFGTRHTETGAGVPTGDEPILISPLTVRLLAALLAKTGAGAEDPLFGLQAANEQLDAELYLRILGHIEDPLVRAVAHPGLVLRRITPEIIRDVLAKSGGVELGKVDERDLFNRLAAEPMLVDRPEPDVLEHRQDVRAVMLPQILRDTTVDARSVQLAAVDYYTRRRDPVSRAEEIYHRLLLGQGRDKLDPIWDPRAAERLVTAVDELPQRSRVLLLSRLPRAFVGDDDRRLLDDAEWLEKVEPTVGAMLSRGRAPEGPGAAPRTAPRRRWSAPPARRDRGVGGAGAARRGHRPGRAGGGGRGHGPGPRVRHRSQPAAVPPRSSAPDDPLESLAVLDRATAVSREHSVDRLRLLVAWLGVARRNAIGTTEARRHRVDEAVDIGRTATTRRLEEYPGLLRDLAAEVGDEAGDVLDTALRSVGFDAHKSGDVPDALAELADSPARTNQVVDLLRLDQDPRGTVEWRQVVNQNRADSGLGVAEVLSAFPKDAESLREAVLSDYRSEADAAYRGVDQSDELRWDGPS